MLPNQIKSSQNDKSHVTCNSHGTLVSLSLNHNSFQIQEADERTALLPLPSSSLISQKPSKSKSLWTTSYGSALSISVITKLGLVGFVILISTFIISYLKVGYGQLEAANQDTTISTTYTQESGLFHILDFFQNIADSMSDALQQSAVANLKSVSLYDITDGKVQVHVNASLSMNYTNVEDRRWRRLIQMAAFPLHSISMKNMTVELYIKKESTSSSQKSLDYYHGAEDNDEYYDHALTLEVPTINNIKTPLNKLTDIDFIANMSSFDSPMLLTNTVRKLLIGDTVFIKLVTDLEPRKWFVSFGKYPVSVEATVNPKPE